MAELPAPTGLSQSSGSRARAAVGCHREVADQRDCDAASAASGGQGWERGLGQIAARPQPLRAPGPVGRKVSILHPPRLPGQKEVTDIKK